MSFRPPRGVLATLIDGAREDCARRKGQRPGLIGEVDRQKPITRGFESALRRRVAFGAASEVALICEVKKASPSAGAIRADADAPSLAAAYERGGARCISVLTEGRRFGGSLDDLRAVRARVEVPLLRKDFVVDPYMVYEAADAGADAVLLIAGGVEPSLLRELAICARSLGLDALVEVVQSDEVPWALATESKLLGVNARDLETLEMDAARFSRVAPLLVGDHRIVVAESGVRSPEDVRYFVGQGAGAALVGESLVRAEDPSQAVRALARALG